MNLIFDGCSLRVEADEGQLLRTQLHSLGRCVRNKAVASERGRHVYESHFSSTQSLDWRPVTQYILASGEHRASADVAIISIPKCALKLVSNFLDW